MLGEERGYKRSKQLVRGSYSQEVGAGAGGQRGQMYCGPERSVQIGSPQLGTISGSKGRKPPFRMIKSLRTMKKAGRILPCERINQNEQT